ncbi:peptide ABC transporter substrate-binding protein [Clostridium sp. AF18-27]|uniref:Oligopeptide transport system substrate-binding protein n=2 Tax=Enterocloster lavalensis TaxID=460384 RepID=A0A1I0FMK7_9FIRM|nr:peptide ABC transporter substrate-binding protein [Enterocloster lavalensis]MCB6346196.1 peptide ABC transporter substrate-binding protein [Enterocloster lavalensis]RHR54161.1 peptide ABC transporter substrate-binding protein [Clostridium sp. AF18-27]SET59553.1 oligopeptide transport system substrate-binding protein [Enterocloster lavalensis]
MKKRMLVSLLLATAAAATLSACGSGSKPAETQATTNQGGGDITSAAEEETEAEAEEEASAGSDRYLVWRLNKEPKLWDPTNNSESISDAIVKQLFEGLTVSTSDGFKPGIAESWDVSEDGKTYTFHLRDDAKWSDGDPVTAKDFEYSWRRICDPDYASEALQAITDYVVGGQEYFDGTGSYDDIKATAIDDYTFEVVLKNVTPYFPQLVANDVYLPIKKDVVEAAGEGWEKKPETCVSNGPFMLEEYQVGSHFLFKKNPNYYDADSVKLAGVKAVIITDDNTAYQAYQAGEIDVMDNLPSEQIPQIVAEDPNVIVSADTGAQFMNFNVDKAPTDNVHVRKAIAYAIDRKQIVEQVLKDGSVPASGFIAPTCQKTDGGSFRTMESDGYPAEEYGINPRQANVEAAKQELAEAGYPDGKDFPALEITYANNDRNKKTCEAIQQMLEDNLGITVTLRAEESSVFTSTKNKGDYQMATGGWTNSPYDASGLIKLFYSQNGNNTPQWRWKPYTGAPHDTTLNPGNEAFDIAFDKALASQGADRDNAWIEAEQALMADMPVTPLYYPSYTAVVNEDLVEDVELTASNTFMFKSASVIE